MTGRATVWIIQEIYWEYDDSNYHSLGGSDSIEGYTIREVAEEICKEKNLAAFKDECCDDTPNFNYHLYDSSYGGNSKFKELFKKYGIRDDLSLNQEEIKELKLSDDDIYEIMHLADISFYKIVEIPLML